MPDGVPQQQSTMRSRSGNGSLGVDRETRAVRPD
jgi:hypothetical protein